MLIILWVRFKPVLFFSVLDSSGLVNLKCLFQSLVSVWTSLLNSGNKLPSSRVLVPGLTERSILEFLPKTWAREGQAPQPPPPTSHSRGGCRNLNRFSAPVECSPESCPGRPIYAKRILSQDCGVINTPSIVCIGAGCHRWPVREAGP